MREEVLGEIHRPGDGWLDLDRLFRPRDARFKRELLADPLSEDGEVLILSTNEEQVLGRGSPNPKSRRKSQRGRREREVEHEPAGIVSAEPRAPPRARSDSRHVTRATYSCADNE